MKIQKLTGAAALTFLVAAAPVFAVNTHANGRATVQSGWSASQRAQAEQYFQRLDRNGDGRLTRDEFPADASLFDSLDLNRDGVLTRAEVEQAVPNRAAAERKLRGYDRNGDGVITRDEFPGNDQAFARLDRNHDGVISELDRQGAHGAKAKRNAGKMRQE